MTNFWQHYVANGRVRRGNPLRRSLHVACEEFITLDRRSTAEKQAVLLRELAGLIEYYERPEAWDD